MTFRLLTYDPGSRWGSLRLVRKVRHKGVQESREGADSAVFEAPDSRRQPNGDLASLQTAPKIPLPAENQHRRPRARGLSRWHWLVVVAVVIPLLTPLYNHAEQQLFGLPFFYWSQMAFIGLAACVTAVVYQVTKRRGS